MTGSEPSPKHGGTVLTDQLAFEIYGYKLLLQAMPASFESCIQPAEARIKSKSAPVADRYGVSPKTVRDIWNRRTWAHATAPLWSQEQPGTGTIQNFDAEKIKVDGVEYRCRRGRPAGSKDKKPRSRKSEKHKDPVTQVSAHPPAIGSICSAATPERSPLLISSIVDKSTVWESPSSPDCRPDDTWHPLAHYIQPMYLPSGCPDALHHALYQAHQLSAMARTYMADNTPKFLSHLDIDPQQQSRRVTPTPECRRRDAGTPSPPPPPPKPQQQLPGIADILRRAQQDDWRLGCAGRPVPFW